MRANQRHHSQRGSCLGWLLGAALFTPTTAPHVGAAATIHPRSGAWRYQLFWALLLACKLAFSFFVEILPSVRGTVTIWESDDGGADHMDATVARVLLTTLTWHGEYFPHARPPLDQMFRL